MTLVLGPIALINFANRPKEIMETSSTTKISQGKGLLSLYKGFSLWGITLMHLWTVVAVWGSCLEVFVDLEHDYHRRAT